MVFFNYATMQMAAKIVYYGPGLCGKTTNLQHVYNKTSPQSRGEMVSLETETDRTLFFDLLPIEAGVIGGFKTRLQLYTVPGQVFYNTTRKLVLKGADGIVFVADSQAPMLEANLQSLRNLRTNLEELGLDLDELPLVIQLNKRDLPNVLPVSELEKQLNPDGSREVVEASAVRGEGVFETLKLVSKLTLKGLRSRMTGEKELPSKASFQVHSKPRTAPPPQTDAEPARAESPTTSDESKRTVSVPYPDAAPQMLEREPVTATGVIEREDADPSLQGTLPGDEVVPPSAFPSGEPAPDDESSTHEAEPEVKRVKVRSTVDILAELEVLRRNATGKVKSDEKTPAQRKEVHKTLHIEPATGVRNELRSVSVVVELRDAEGNAVSTEARTYDVDPDEVRKLLLSLDLDLS